MHIIAQLKLNLQIYSVKPLYLIFRYVNGYFEEIDGNKYFMLVSTNESKKNKNYKKIWRIRYLIRSITKNSYDYDEKGMKIKFNSDYELTPNKAIEIPTMTMFFELFFLKVTKSF